jgi:hypothetical protein
MATNANIKQEPISESEMKNEPVIAEVEIKNEPASDHENEYDQVMENIEISRELNMHMNLTARVARIMINGTVLLRVRVLTAIAIHLSNGRA